MINEDGTRYTFSNGNKCISPRREGPKRTLFALRPSPAITQCDKDACAYKGACYISPIVLQSSMPQSCTMWPCYKRLCGRIVRRCSLLQSSTPAVWMGSETGQSHRRQTYALRFMLSAMDVTSVIRLRLAGLGLRLWLKTDNCLGRHDSRVSSYLPVRIFSVTYLAGCFHCSVL